MKQKKTVAILLAAGMGKRMQSSTAKQYLLLDGRPILYYSLKAFEDSMVDEIILVVGKNETEYCKELVFREYPFTKINKITEGGKERYHSVYHGLKEIESADNVLIHDGVRPFITVEIINKVIHELTECDACVVGVPTKDTVKIVDKNGIVIETPERDLIWSVQTPQAFKFNIILDAYGIIMKSSAYNSSEEPDREPDIPMRHDRNPQVDSGTVCRSDKVITITDDAMVVENTLNKPVKMIMGSYHNIKITTPEDLIIGEAFLKMQHKK